MLFRSAIFVSRKIILVLSREFTRSEWCDFAAQMALFRGMNNVMCIILEDLGHAIYTMPASLRSLLMNNRYIEWPEDREQNKRKLWKFLKYFIQLNQRIRPRGNEQDNERQHMPLPV